jgi:hypothetical protein
MKSLWTLAFVACCTLFAQAQTLVPIEQDFTPAGPQLQTDLPNKNLPQQLERLAPVKEAAAAPHHPDHRNCAQNHVEDQIRQQDVAAWEARMNQIHQLAMNYLENSDPSELRSSTLTIPVHVVVVHKSSESIGVGRNISLAQIQSQIDILNEDYQALNSDIGGVPSIFAGVVGNVNFEFCLADTDPNGNPTDGITRYVNNNNTLSTSTIDNTVKPATNWDPSRYMNLYCASISGGILGYAYFPGISPAYLDGPVVTYTAFGDIGTASAPFDKGRTATHEVGHYFGLRHIWGDGPCSFDDGFADTPTSDGPNYGCPGTTSSCGSTDMSMNYMDYVNDACMYMFSDDQANYMNGILGSSRSGLLSSDGCSGSGGGSCAVPGGLFASSITSTDAQLNWASVPGATSYNARARQVGTTTWATGSTSGLSIGFTGLSACTDYEFQVEAVCGGTSSGFSSSTIFTSGGCGSSCPVPSGLFASSITTSDAVLNWGSVSGATSYNARARAVGTTTWATGSTSGLSIGFTGLSACTDYEFQVEAVCGGSTSGFSSSTIFTSAGCSGGSCSASSYCNANATNTSDEWIGSVTIGSATSTTGDNGGYYNGTGSTLTSLSTGSSYSIQVVPVWSGVLYNEYSRIWIDYNQDGDYNDAGELAFDQGSATSVSPVNGTIVIPSSASIGTTGMRVIMRYNTAPSSCGTFTYGEVEDYCVEITSGGGSSCSVPAGLNTTINSSTSITLSWGSVSGASNYTLQGRRVGGPWNTFTVSGTSASFTVPCCNSYEWRIRANCGGTSSAYSAIQPFTMPGLRDVEVESFKLYPNPASSQLTLEFEASVDNDAQVQIIDALGRVQLIQNIAAIQGSNRIQLNLGDLAAGLYQVILDQSGELKITTLRVE